MSGTFRDYCEAIFETSDDVHRDGGSRAAPLKEVTLAGTSIVNETIIIPAGESKVIWAWDTEGDIDFDFFRMRLIGGGYLWVGVHVDTPVSSDDLTPSGTTPRVRVVGLSCHTPFTLNTSATLINATLSTEVGVDADGLPNLFTGLGVVSGRIYKVSVKNPGTADVRLRRSLIK